MEGKSGIKVLVADQFSEEGMREMPRGSTLAALTTASAGGKTRFSTNTDSMAEEDALIFLNPKRFIQGVILLKRDQMLKCQIAS